MRINGTFGPEKLNGPGSKANGKSKASAGKDAARSGSTESVFVSGPMISAALGAQEVDTEAVKVARQLLDSGQLDTPDAARRMAERLLDMGI